MKVFLILPAGEERTAAEVLAVKENGLDLRVRGGTLYGWTRPVYDENGSELLPEQIRQRLVSADTQALLERIAQLEAMATKE